MLQFILSFFTALAFTVALMPAVVALSKKLKARQIVLHYVDNHAQKSGTPTMGGLGFIAAIVCATLICVQGPATLTVAALLVTAGYGVVGFLDDFIKVYFRRNKGLSPWQKIVFQGVIALAVSIFALYNELIGGAVYVPFTLATVELGWFAVPFFMFLFIAFTNAVNLTDGLDGLASSVTFVYMIFNAGLIFVAVYLFGEGAAVTAEYRNLIVFSCAVAGALLGFLCFNGYPAKIFMGDTGALALGGAVGALAVVSGMSLYSPMVGIMYVITTLSVLLQVGYFKATKGKRIFLMAPLHHHFERKGVHENRIVTVYTAVTAAVGSLCLLLTIAVSF